MPENKQGNSGSSGQGRPQSQTYNAPQQTRTGTQSGDSQTGAGQRTQQKANQAVNRAAEQIQSTFENARENVTTQLEAVARALDSASSTLNRERQNRLAQRVQGYIRKTENAAEYLHDKSPRELRDDLDRFARAKRAWFLGGAFLAGLLGARFLKASEKGAVEHARV